MATMKDHAENLGLLIDEIENTERITAPQYEHA